MRTRLITTTGLAIVSGALVLGVPAVASAQEVCDSYSGECPDGGTEVDGNGGGAADGGGGGGTGGGSVSDARGLPVTGGELVLLSAVGVGALVGGTALVVAGRRKHASA